MSHPVGQRPTLQVFLPRMTFVIPLFRFQGSPCSSSIRRSGRALTPNAFGADRRMIAFAGSGDIPVAESSSGDKNVAPPSYPAIRWRCGRARLRMLSRASRRARRIVVSAGPAACHVSRGPALPFGGQRPPNDRISWERRHSCRRIIIGRQGCRPSQLSGDQPRKPSGSKTAATVWPMAFCSGCFFKNGSSPLRVNYAPLVSHAFPQPAQTPVPPKHNLKKFWRAWRDSNPRPRV